LDFLFNSGKKIAEAFTGQKVPGTFKNGKLVFDKNAFLQSGRRWNSFIKSLHRGVGFTGVSIIPQSGRGVKCLKRKKTQKGKDSSLIYSKRKPNKP
jgi:hypothetical protein